MASVNVTPGYVWTSGETVTPTKLNSAAAPTATATLADGEVTNTKLASGIDAGKLTTGTLPVARIADGALTTAKIADGGVTLAKLVTAVQQALLPAGAVQAFAMNSAPAGWLAADGSNVNRTTYAALFTAIGTTYGAGDGSTTFALPDLRGYFVRGSGTNGDGTAAGTFGAKQADLFRSHNHGVNDPGHQHSYTDEVRVSNGVFTSAGGTGQDGASNVGRLTALNFTSVSIQAAGGAETRPANIAMLYCIKF
jgi:microcystin-dependent protein